MEGVKEGSQPSSLWKAGASGMTGTRRGQWVLAMKASRPILHLRHDKSMTQKQSEAGHKKGGNRLLAWVGGRGQGAGGRGYRH